MGSVSERLYLEHLLGDVRIISQHKVRLGAGEFAVPAAGPDPEAQNRMLHTALLEVLYINGYCRRYAGQAVSQISIGEQDLSGALSEANTGRTLYQSDWQVQRMETDGGVTCTRHDHMQKFSPGQFFSQDGQLPIVVGARVTAIFPREFKGGSQNFYFAFGEAVSTIADDDRLVRVYWHVRHTGAVLLTNILTKRLNQIRIPFRFKIGASTTSYDRCDAAVLYIARRHFDVAAAILVEILPQVSPHLSPETPLFTKHLTAGLSMSEDPGTGESFGQSRCKLLADAILTCWRHADQSTSSRIEAVEHALSLKRHRKGQSATRFSARKSMNVRTR